MLRFDVLRMTLLAALGASACTSRPLAEGGSGSEGTSNGSTEAETTEGPTCEDDCVDPVEIADGVVRCADGSLNRVSAGEFVPQITGDPCLGTEDEIACMSDADCGDGFYGTCLSSSYFDPFVGEEISQCRCTYSCANDSECDEGEICLAPEAIGEGNTVPTCISAECTNNEDCGPCGECAIGAYDDGCGINRTVQCRTQDDACRADADCGEFEACFPFTNPDVWECHGGSCDIGRPLLVDGRARRAHPRARRDWRSPLAFTPTPDAELADYWANIAALEHASVASFARFATQLLALGAPPRLLRATHAAARDEVEHAKLSYALASAYAGEALGPDRLELEGVELRASWHELVDALIREACVGETLGVAEATSAAASATPPALRELLERIAADELRHAQLAWSALDWLLTHASQSDRSWALARLEACITEHRLPSGGLDRPAAGVLGGPRWAAVHRDAIEQVLTPLARTLRERFEPRERAAVPCS